ncbi:S8 family serine peptidase [Parerythrobacter aestuarii]|uniref:S8 family serine peptidase n=1 Tax=Parerythrobacter aestuarii TaxID=3020909 RepID=UPI0024DE888B|nr:S8 family serine peptidase [Parerythrobacter aestuarii]
MMRMVLPTLLATMIVASPLAAQLLPQVQVPDVGGTVGGVTETLDQTLEGVDETVQREARRLLRTRDRTLDRLLRRNRDSIARDVNGDLARKGELLAMGVTAQDQAAIDDAGFRVLSTETIEGLGLTITRLALPDDLDLAEAEALARELGIGTQISADNLHYQSGARIMTVSSAPVPATVRSAASIGVEVGMIDGATGPWVRPTAAKGFAQGAPAASNHGSAVASLLKGAGVARVRVADVYGTDPAGGNALAIARGLGWLVASGSEVVTISLVGPRNAVVEQAIAAAQRKGVVMVAAVGNDGPAAPPAYPASYDGVVAVTGVDSRNRALIEAGRALHLDYAAPGADVFALDAQGTFTKWRGTSFATPLAAARLAAAIERGGNWRTVLDREARDLGPKGPDATYGRGLLCGDCARKK